MANTRITQKEKIIVKAAGAAGPRGIAGSSFLQGHGSPSNSLGNNGDSYLNTDTSFIYKKIDGSWQNPQALLSVGLFSYTYEKQINALIWNITHNLKFKPNIIVMDYGSNQVECDIEYVNENSVKLTFSEAVSGYAYLS
jgi:hypothetical protein